METFFSQYASRTSWSIHVIISIINRDFSLQICKICFLFMRNVYSPTVLVSLQHSLNPLFFLALCASSQPRHTINPYVLSCRDRSELSIISYIIPVVIYQIRFFVNMSQRSAVLLAACAEFISRTGSSTSGVRRWLKFVTKFTRARFLLFFLFRRPPPQWSVSRRSL